MTLDTQTVMLLAVLVSVIGASWQLHTEISSLRSEVHTAIADLRERMARLEGLFEGFTRGEREPPTPPAGK